MVVITREKYQLALNKLQKRFAKNTLKGMNRTRKMIFKKAAQLGIIDNNPTEYTYIPKQ